MPTMRRVGFVCSMRRQFSTNVRRAARSVGRLGITKTFSASHLPGCEWLGLPRIQKGLVVVRGKSRFVQQLSLHKHHLVETNKYLYPCVLSRLPLKLKPALRCCFNGKICRIEKHLVVRFIRSQLTAIKFPIVVENRIDLEAFDQISFGDRKDNART